MRIAALSFALLGLHMGVSAHGEVISAGPDNFTLKLEAESSATPSEIWTRLIDPPQWWQSAHTYSGDAANLSLDPQAGGLWREDWEGRSVWHGTVIQAHPEQSLVLSAPFGPLQGLAVTSIWTITLAPSETGGTNIRFDHVTTGASSSNLQDLAPAVDFVKSEALASLARPLDE